MWGPSAEASAAACALIPPQATDNTEQLHIPAALVWRSSDRLRLKAQTTRQCLSQTVVMLTWGCTNWSQTRVFWLQDYSREKSRIVLNDLDIARKSRERSLCVQCVTMGQMAARFFRCKCDAFFIRHMWCIKNRAQDGFRPARNDGGCGWGKEISITSDVKWSGGQSFYPKCSISCIIWRGRKLLVTKRSP